MAYSHSLASQKVGQIIAERRRTLGVSARTLAAFADLDVTHVQRLEKGAGNPTLMTLVHIAVALGADPGTLIAGLGADDLPSGRAPVLYTPNGDVGDEPDDSS